MFGLWWELRQQQEIHQANVAAGQSLLTAEKSLNQARDSRLTSNELADRFNRLLLVCQAMWTLLQEKTGLTEEDLLERVVELDLRDGRLDGQIARQVVKCGKCGFAVSYEFMRCLHCGEKYVPSSAFEGV